jgi:hypothetical protein
MQNQTLILLLTLLMNTGNALIGFAAFKQGSVAFIICAVASAAISNTLALFGRPVVKKLDGIETPKV